MNKKIIFRKRFLALSSSHQVICRRLKRQLTICMLLSEYENFKGADVDDLTDLLLMRYMSYIPISPLETIIADIKNQLVLEL